MLGTRESMPVNEAPWLTRRNAVLLTVITIFLCFICDDLKCKHNNSSWCVGPVPFRCLHDGCESTVTGLRSVSFGPACTGKGRATLMLHALDIGPALLSQTVPAAGTGDASETLESVGSTLAKHLSHLMQDPSAELNVSLSKTVLPSLIGSRMLQPFTAAGEARGNTTVTVGFDRLPFTVERSGTYMTKLGETLTLQRTAHVALTKFFTTLNENLEREIALRSTYEDAECHVLYLVVFLFHSLGVSPALIEGDANDVAGVLAQAHKYTRLFVTKTLSERPNINKHLNGVYYVLLPFSFPAPVPANSTSDEANVTASFPCAGSNKQQCIEACRAAARQKPTAAEANAALGAAAARHYQIPTINSVMPTVASGLSKVVGNASLYSDCFFINSVGLDQLARQMLLTGQA